MSSPEPDKPNARNLLYGKRRSGGGQKPLLPENNVEYFLACVGQVYFDSFKRFFDEMLKEQLGEAEYQELSDEERKAAVKRMLEEDDALTKELGVFSIERLSPEEREEHKRLKENEESEEESGDLAIRMFSLRVRAAMDVILRDWFMDGKRAVVMGSEMHGYTEVLVVNQAWRRDGEPWVISGYIYEYKPYKEYGQPRRYEFRDRTLDEVATGFSSELRDGGVLGAILRYGIINDCKLPKKEIDHLVALGTEDWNSQDEHDKIEIE